MRLCLLPTVPSTNSTIEHLSGAMLQIGKVSFLILELFSG